MTLQSSAIAPTGATAAVAQQQQYIGLNLPPDLKVLLPNTYVTEVITLSAEQIVSLPETSPCLMGLSNWRGEVLWLVDISALFGREPLYRRAPNIARLGVFDGIVVQYQQYTVGFVVDQVTQLQQLPLSEIRPLVLERKVPSIPDLQGVWLSPQGDRAWILDTAATVNYIIQSVTSARALSVPTAAA
jgi:positive phototaxis protein PixI